MSDLLKINELRKNIVKLIEAKFELTKLGFQEKLEGIAVKTIYAFLLFILSITVVIFLSILAAVGLNIWLKSAWLGYLIIFLIYVSILTTFVFAKDKVQAKIRETVQDLVDDNLNQEKTDN